MSHACFFQLVSTFDILSTCLDEAFYIIFLIQILLQEKVLTDRSPSFLPPAGGPQIEAANSLAPHHLGEPRTTPTRRYRVSKSSQASSRASVSPTTDRGELTGDQAEAIKVINCNGMSGRTKEWLPGLKQSTTGNKAETFDFLIDFSDASPG